ncbi:MAG: FHA domain-containing protein [Candidatus Planktophila sp.]|nr:FHA domain-containing protein [Candidatus Planktophila sp.]
MEQSKEELTSTLHLSSREVSSSPTGLLADYVASLPERDRAVVRKIQSSGGDKAMILINRGENKGSRFLITHEGVTVGRSPSSAVFLDDVTVSRAHAVVEKRGKSFFLRDCGSLNGTYVNNESVSEIVLNSGDEIQIGKFHLLFVSGLAKAN